LWGRVVCGFVVCGFWWEKEDKRRGETGMFWPSTRAAVAPEGLLTLLWCWCQQPQTVLNAAAPARAAAVARPAAVCAVTWYMTVAFCAHKRWGEARPARRPFCRCVAGAHAGALLRQAVKQREPSRWHEVLLTHNQTAVAASLPSTVCLGEGRCKQCKGTVVCRVAQPLCLSQYILCSCVVARGGVLVREHCRCSSIACWGLPGALAPPEGGVANMQHRRGVARLLCSSSCAAAHLQIFCSTTPPAGCHSTRAAHPQSEGLSCYKQMHVLCTTAAAQRHRRPNRGCHWCTEGCGPQTTAPAPPIKQGLPANLKP
jgi:hypothetical protein